MQFFVSFSPPSRSFLTKIIKIFKMNFFLFYYQSGFNKVRKLALFSYNCNALFILYYGWEEVKILLMSFTGRVFCIRNLILILRNSFLRFVCLAKPMASELQQANSSSVFLRSLLSCHSIALCPRFIFVTETCNSRNEFGIFLKSQLTFEFDFSAMYSLYFLNRVYSLYEVNFI